MGGKSGGGRASYTRSKSQSGVTAGMSTRVRDASTSRLLVIVMHDAVISKSELARWLAKAPLIVVAGYETRSYKRHSLKPERLLHRAVVSIG